MDTQRQKPSPIRHIVLGGISAKPARNSVTETAAGMITTILADYHGDIAVRLWDGRIIHGACDAPTTIVFREPGALRDLILHHDLLRLADSYLTGAIDVEGNLESVFTLKTYLRDLTLPLTTRLHLLHQALHLPPLPRNGATRAWRATRKARRNSQASIAHHYDVSNDFYRLWLDPEMVYSCAYFSDTDQSLAAAQRDKLDYLCRKLRLQAGQTLLDIGCGWGALACWAARHYDVKVHGITLSKQQLIHAREKAHSANLEQQVSFELLDYRDLPQDRRYDRIVSVGMFEHIGVKNFPTYFTTVRKLLKPNGLFLNHGITDETGWQKTPMTCFMNRYIFPDGELARISDVTDAMEKAGFEVLDIESMRRHYALTLRHWVAALEKHRDAAIHHSSEMTYRLWRLYMAGCAYNFAEGGIGLHQVLVGHQHAEQPIPLRRDDLYATVAHH